MWNERKTEKRTLNESTVVTDEWKSPSLYRSWKFNLWSKMSNFGSCMCIMIWISAMIPDAKCVTLLKTCQG